MKNLSFNKAIQDIKKISMTPAEKRLILERIMSGNASLIKPDQIHAEKSNNLSSPRSPWNIYSFGISIRRHRFVSVAVIVVIVMFAGNSVVMASYKTLPGDTLYPVKISVVEPIKIAFAGTTVAKAEIRAELVKERLREAERLAVKGMLTDSVEQKLNQRIEEQTTNLIEDVRSLEKVAPEKAEDIKMTVEASIEGHGHVLEALAMDQGESSDDKKTDKVIVATDARGVGAFAVDMKKESGESVEKNTDKKIGKALSVASTKESSGNDNKVEIKEKEKEKTKSEYENRKTRLQSSIMDVSTKISKATSTISSPAQSSIENEIQATLDKARWQLDDADMHIQKGEDKDSRSALVDSERFLKEANFLLEAKTRLENEVKSENSKESSSKGDKEKESKKIENKREEKKPEEVRDNKDKKVEKDRGEESEKNDGEDKKK